MSLVSAVLFCHHPSRPSVVPWSPSLKPTGSLPLDFSLTTFNLRNSVPCAKKLSYIPKMDGTPAVSHPSGLPSAIKPNATHTAITSVADLKPFQQDDILDYLREAKKSLLGEEYYPGPPLTDKEKEVFFDEVFRFWDSGKEHQYPNPSVLTPGPNDKRVKVAFLNPSGTSSFTGALPPVYMRAQLSAHDEVRDLPPSYAIVYAEVCSRSPSNC